MSLFHRTISVAVGMIAPFDKLENPIPETTLHQILDNIHNHIIECKNEFKVTVELGHFLKRYYQELEIAHDALQDRKKGSTKAALEHLRNAHGLVLDIEAETRKLFGDEHKFLQ